MAVYSNDEQLYDTLRELFDRIEANEPDAAARLLKSGLAIRFACVDPSSLLTIDARRDPVQISYGSNSLKPSIEASMSADTLHCLLLGELRLSKAVGSKRVTLAGPVHKTFALQDLFRSAQQHYPLVLQQRGLFASCPG